jgi:hypothetical protein
VRLDFPGSMRPGIVHPETVLKLKLMTKVPVNGRRALLARLLFGKQRTAIFVLILGCSYWDTCGFANFWTWEQFGAEFRCRDCARIECDAQEKARNYIRPGVTRHFYSTIS